MPATNSHACLFRVVATGESRRARLKSPTESNAKRPVDWWYSIRLPSLHESTCEERIRSLNRSVLARIARKYQPGISLADQANEFEHLPSANLTGFVHDHDRTGDKLTLDKETGDR